MDGSCAWLLLLSPMQSMPPDGNQSNMKTNTKQENMHKNKLENMHKN